MNEIIQTEIKVRKIIYYTVSDSELDSIRETSIGNEIFKFLASLGLTMLISIFLVFITTPEMHPETKITLTVVAVAAGIIFLIFLSFTIYSFMSIATRIKLIKGKSPERLTIEKFTKQTNPQYYVGGRIILMNISLSQKHFFFQLIEKEKQYSLLKTSNHRNKRETDYFTFKILNGNDHLFQDFEEFLKENNIDYIDYA